MKVPRARDGHPTPLVVSAPPRTRAGRVLRRLRWPVVGAWILLVVLLHPLAGTLYRVTDDSAGANLPGGAQSTRVIALTAGETARHRDGGITQNSVAAVFARPGGLTRTDDRSIESARASVQRLVGHGYGLARPGRVRIAGDERAAVFTDTVTAPTQHATSADLSAVAAIRHALGVAVDRDRGLRTGVSGVAAVTADGGVTSQTSLLVTAVVVVGLVLLVVYGSLLIWIFPLLSALGGIVVAQAAAHGLGSAGLTVSSLSTSILIVLSFGLASDYALLLMHRYREELRRTATPEDAMAAALRRTVPTLVASAATVISAMACLLAAHAGSLQGLGPVGMVAVTGALLAQTTFLPALLLLVGRSAFWPRRPRSTGAEQSRLWSRIAATVGRHPGLVAGGVLLVLGVATAGLLSFHADDNPLDNLRDRSDSVAATQLVAAHFGAGVDAPLTVLVPKAEATVAVTTARTTAGVAAVGPTSALDGRLSFPVTLAVDPYGGKGATAIESLRQRLAAVAPGSLVGGDAAIRYDVRRCAARDAEVLIPLILLAVLFVVAALLRAAIVPLVLVLTTGIGFAASLGAAVVLWKHLFGFSGIESQLPLYVFVFMVSLGVDYSVFLAARVREEAGSLGSSGGITRGLEATGGMITAAGVVLAGTFAALAERPLVDLAEVGTAIALGVLVDTVLIRTVLVPAVLHIAGDRAWWPARPRPVDGVAR